jgi:hypothetical protein
MTAMGCFGRIGAHVVETLRTPLKFNPVPEMLERLRLALWL